MIEFVNAKLNLGLNILRKRPDGYHELSTLFYPVGIFNGTPLNPEPFCDILEINPSRGLESTYSFTGNHVDCEPDRNLAVKALREFEKAIALKGLKCQPVDLVLEKHIPDGAGLGGGSADASFTLRMLNSIHGNPLQVEEMVNIAARIGADCPFFILNRPVMARGIGEIMTPSDVSLDGYWAVIVKPSVYISTGEAFASIKPEEPDVSLEEIVSRPVDKWRELGLHNDFEPGIFAKHPRLGEIKEQLYVSGAVYSAMSGSGSSIFGIFPSRDEALWAMMPFREQVYICRL